MVCRATHIVVVSLSLICLVGDAHTEPRAASRKGLVTVLDAHQLLGPFKGPEEYFGCKRNDCFEDWSSTVHKYRSSTADGADGAQYVSTRTPNGWYVDSRPIDQYLCPKDVQFPASGSNPHSWAVQFFSCDVDSPDGVFAHELVGVVLCELASTGPVCSEFTSLRGWNAHFEELARVKVPVSRVDHDLVVAGHRDRKSVV